MGTSYNGIVLYDNKNVDDFLRSHFLHWLEALSLIKSMSSGVSAIAKLTDMIRVSHFPRLSYTNTNFFRMCHKDLNFLS